MHQSMNYNNHNSVVVKRNRNRVVRVKPNRPKVIVKRPNRFRPGYVWVEGHWKWNSYVGRYVWQRARWKKIKRGLSAGRVQSVATRLIYA